MSVADHRLRIGVLLPAPVPPAWIAEAITQLAALPIDLVVGVGLPPATASTALRLAEGLARRLHAPDPDPEAPRRLDLPPRPPSAETTTPWGDLQEDGFDLLLSLGLPAPHPLPMTRHGAWELIAGDGRAWRATLADAGAVDVSLRRVDAAAAPLRPSGARVHRLSPATTRARALWRAAQLPARAVGDVLANRVAPAPALGDDDARDRDDSAPAAWRLPLDAARLAGRALRTGARRALTRNHWFVAVDVADRGSLPDLAGMTALAAPADRFWADPFPVVDGDRGWVFVEEWPYALDRGRLAVLEIDRRGTWNHLGTILDGPDHLSHPFLFVWQGQTWMLPETSARRTLELYRCVEFPLRWELEAVVMRDVDLVDATLHQEDGRWWLFANRPAPHASAHEELHLFHADAPTGPWTAHPANPVVSDPRGARPAGRLFQRDGRWLRPGQDCGIRYGAALILHEVDQLTTAAYAEHAVQRLEPRGLAGANRLHTLNADGWLTVVDGHRDRWRPT